MKKRVVFLVCLLILSSWGVRVYDINQKYQPEGRKEYCIGDYVEVNGYQYKVNTYKILAPSEYEAKYGMTADQKERLINGESEIKAYVIVVNCTVKKIDADATISMANLHLQSGAWNNGPANPFLYTVNPQMNEDWSLYLKNGGNDVNIPFVISASQVKSFDDRMIRTRDYELILNMTPVYTVRFY